MFKKKEESKRSLSSDDLKAVGFTTFADIVSKMQAPDKLIFCCEEPSWGLKKGLFSESVMLALENGVQFVFIYPIGQAGWVDGYKSMLPSGVRDLIKMVPMKSGHGIFALGAAYIFTRRPVSGLEQLGECNLTMYLYLDTVLAEKSITLGTDMLCCRVAQPSWFARPYDSVFRALQSESLIFE